MNETKWDLILNCTGLISFRQDELFQNRKFEMNEYGQVNNRISFLGSLLQNKILEITAIPDIRYQIHLLIQKQISEGRF